MVAKANSSKEDITGILFKLKDGRDDDISVFAVNEDAVLVGNLQYSEVQRILDMLLTKGYVDISVYDYQPKTSIIAAGPQPRPIVLNTSVVVRQKLLPIPGITILVVA